MQGNVKLAVKVAAMGLLSSLMCLFIQVSFYSIMKSFSTEVVGYQVIKLSEVDGATEEEDLGVISVDEAPEETESGMRYIPLYPDVPTSVKAVETVLSAVFSLGVFFCLAGTVFAKVAAKDRNDSDFNGGVFDKNKGLKISLLASSVPFAFFVATLILRLIGKASNAVNMFYWVYRFVIMGTVKPIIDTFTGDVMKTFVIDGKTYTNSGTITNLADVPVAAIAVQGVFILLFIAFGYVMYRICYNEDSVIAKLLYKSTQDNQKTRRLGGR